MPSIERRRYRRAALLRGALTLALTAVAVGATSAGASAAWTLESTPNASGLTSSAWTGISCTSSTVCMAVGTAGSPNTGIAASRSGSTWTPNSIAVPFGTTASEATDVSCTTSPSSVCVVVGSYTTGSGNVPLATQYNGSTWSVLPTAIPAGATSARLTAVSCTASNACTAAGTYTSASGTLPFAERWNGSTWTVQSMPAPSTSVAITGVSCATATWCVASGRSLSALTQLIETWNGTSWSIATVPSPALATETDLIGVSCTSATACTAAGGWKDASAFQSPHVVRWNGSAWSLQTSPAPSGTIGSVFQDVSCSTATNCVAIGNFVNGSGTLTTWGSGWNGTTWTVQTTAAPPAGTTSSRFDDVSCVAGPTCRAAGTATVSGVVRTYGQVGP